MDQSKLRSIAFAIVVMLFFAWGFINANNDPLIAALLRAFSLTYTQSISVQLVSFLAFMVLSMPVAGLLDRIGAPRTILTGLAAMACGCVIIASTDRLPSFAIILCGLFVLAGGIVALQVAANPLAATMGPPERSHFRLTLAQSFNALGAVLGVHFGAWTMLGSRRTEALDISAVSHAFLMIGAALIALAGLILLVRHRLVMTPKGIAQATTGARFDAWRSRWALAGAGAIALYVGAEVSIGSMLVLFLASPEGFGISLAASSVHVANFYWGGALVGRFLGSWLLRRVAARRLLPVVAVAAAILCGLSLVLPGRFGGWCLLGVGLFNSVMFPTIFTLTLERSTASHSSTSGLLCGAIGAGAILPFLAATLADHVDLRASFGAPFVGYIYVACFAVAVARTRMLPN